MIVLDTHIWVWWAMGEERLQEHHRAKIVEHEPDGIGVSDISCLEIAMLIERGRLKVPMSALSWLDQALAYPNMRVLPITAQVAATAAGLPPHHKDPFDRVILATAMVLGAVLLTDDKAMHRYANDTSIL